MERHNIERRREIEDEALALGSERAELQRRLRENSQALTAALERAVSHGMPVEHFARLVGVRRQSLYRWRDASRRRGQ